MGSLYQGSKVSSRDTISKSLQKIFSAGFTLFTGVRYGRASGYTVWGPSREGASEGEGYLGLENLEEPGEPLRR